MSSRFGFENLESQSKSSVINNIVLSLALLWLVVSIYIQKLIDISVPSDVEVWSYLLVVLIIIDMVLYFFLGKAEQIVFFLSLFLSFFEIIIMAVVLPTHSLQFALILIGVADMLNLTIAFEEIRGGNGHSGVRKVGSIRRERSLKK
jgi:hypothetical protein